MVYRVMAANDGMDLTTVRAATRLAGVRDHLQVDVLTDAGAFEPVCPDVDHLGSHWTPCEPDAATEALIAEADERVEEFILACGDTPATVSVRKVTTTPQSLLTRAAAEADVLVLPHPELAGSESRAAVRRALLRAASPAYVVGTHRKPRTAHVARHGSREIPDRAWDLVARVLRGQVERISLGEGVPLEPFADWATDVGPAAPGDADAADVIVHLGCARDRVSRRETREVLGPRHVGSNLLLVPA